VSFHHARANTHIHCETIEWFWLFDSHQEFENELRNCLAAFKHIPKRHGRELKLNEWWDRLLVQAHVGTVGDFRPLGNLSYCGFAYQYEVPWSEDDTDLCGAMSKKIRDAVAFGTTPNDILGHLEKWGGYDEFSIARCLCGRDVFQLRYHEAAAERTCPRCGAAHMLCDSAENWDQAQPVEWTCKGCGKCAANIGIGFVIDREGWVRWLNVGQRCANCGRLDFCTSWETAGGFDVYDQV
jgi:hypothetical protein